MNWLDTPDGPVITQWADGHLTCEYPKGRPDWFAITPEAFEGLIALVNQQFPESPAASTASGTPNETGDTT